MHVFLFSFTAYALNFRVCVGVILLAVFTALQLSGSYCMYFPPRDICVACSYFGVAGVMQPNAFVQECVVPYLWAKTWSAKKIKTKELLCMKNSLRPEVEQHP